MIFTSVLLELIHQFHGERSYRAPFYLLKGKRSGQTIQDLHQLNLYGFFNLLPQLTVAEYDTFLDQLHKKHFITQFNESIKLSEQGKAFLLNNPSPTLYGWKFKGNDFIFGKRLNLLIQSISHLSKNDRQFVPIVRSEPIQKFAKGWLQSNYHSYIADQLFTELMTLLGSELFLPIEREIMTLRLSGKFVTSLTWAQVADKFEIAAIDGYMHQLVALQKMLMEVEKNKSTYRILNSVAQDLFTSNELTNSTQITWEFYQKGYSLLEIAKIRMLKESTVQDHFVEIASVYPEIIHVFLEKRTLQIGLDKVKQVNSTKLAALKKELPTFSYFELRLLLTWKEQDDGRT